MTAVGTRLLKIKIGSTEFTADVTVCKITSKAADPSLQTYGAAATGGARLYCLEFTAGQDTAAASLWRKVFATPGTSAAVTINPHGVTTFTSTTPGYTGNVTIVDPDGDYLGGQANSTVNMRQLFSCVWEFDAKPTELVTGSF